MAAQPDAVVQVSAYKSCAAFIREARKAGYGGTFFNVSFVGTQALADELGKDGAGVVVTQVVPSPYNAADGITREFIDAREARAAATPRPTSPAWKAISRPRCWSRACAARRARLTRDGLIAGLESIDRQQFGGFEVSFSPTQPRGIEVRRTVDDHGRRPDPYLNLRPRRPAHPPPGTSPAAPG